VLAVLPFLATSNTANAKSTLENQGYVVLTSGEYANMLAVLNANGIKLDNIKTSADLAVANAIIAANTSNETLNTLLLHNENVVYLFPDDASSNVTFTAGNPANTFGAWAEIVSNNGTTLSSKFAANSGYLTEMVFRDYSAPDKICVFEIAYGGAKTVVGRVKIKSDFTYVLTLKSARIPAGETLYYRMSSTQAGEIARVDFRYYFRP